jgi:hypothetical protein
MTAEERALEIAGSLLKLALGTSAVPERQVFEAILGHIRSAEADARREALKEALRVVEAHRRAFAVAPTGVFSAPRPWALEEFDGALEEIRALAAKEPK